MVPTSTSRAPDCAITSGTRNPPPISTLSPRETTTSRPRASAASASSTAAALLLTTMAASAPHSRASRRADMRVAGARAGRWRGRARGCCTPASRAAPSGARPRFVCSSTPGGVDDPPEQRPADGLGSVAGPSRRRRRRWPHAPRRPATGAGGRCRPAIGPGRRPTGAARVDHRSPRPASTKDHPTTLVGGVGAGATDHRSAGGAGGLHRGRLGDRCLERDRHPDPGQPRRRLDRQTAGHGHVAPSPAAGHGRSGTHEGDGGWCPVAAGGGAAPGARLHHVGGRRAAALPARADAFPGRAREALVRPGHGDPLHLPRPDRHHGHRSDPPRPRQRLDRAPELGAP